MRFLFASLLAFLIAAPSHAQSTSIDVPAGAKLLLTARGSGLQVYGCTNGQWTLNYPDATLLDAQSKLLGWHTAGPTWKLQDGSEVKGKMIASHPASDGTSIPELLLAAVPGSGKGRFADVAYIRRTETHAGAAPKQPCTGGTLPVVYGATYSFYTAK
ncbi:DUF3455 domain-containing protein [Silvibacterium acidisoli]|uniref:DUF3455 domain-containing protein n=1 Tax=Acidobacteriaceae bacterium ZG23-2 TaxID=2883246 RepID=UPI00406C8E79